MVDDPLADELLRLIARYGAEAVFGATRALRLVYPASAMAVDDMGSVTAMPSRSRIVYTVESELELPSPFRPRHPPASLDDDVCVRSTAVWQSICGAAAKAPGFAGVQPGAARQTRMWPSWLRRLLDCQPSTARGWKG